MPIHNPKRKFCWLALLLSCLWMLNATPALAHKVIVFAWVEGETIHTESKFSGGKPVHEGELIVYDSQERELLRGKTDESGKFSFPVPKKADLKLVLNAGTGHRGVWTVRAEEISQVADQTAPQPDTGSSETASQASAKPAPSEDGKPALPRSANQIKGLSQAELQRIVEKAVEKQLPPNHAEVQRIVEKAVEKQLRPVLRLLAEARQEEGPDMNDIFGGIGYIIGLVGIGAYFNARSKGRR
jgi:nickel transport protein